MDRVNCVDAFVPSEGVPVTGPRSRLGAPSRRPAPPGVSPMNVRACAACVAVVAVVFFSHPAAARPTPALDAELQAALDDAGFTGTVESTLEDRLGRPLDLELADL